MPNSNEMQELSEMLGRYLPPAVIVGGETVEGWAWRLVGAGMQYIRDGETAEAWERMVEVERQALAFLKGRADEHLS